MSLNVEKQERRVFVGQIPDGVCEDDIRKVFEKYGELVGVDYMTKGGKAHYAFVEYRNKEDVEEVLLNKDRISLGGSEVRLGRANPSNRDDRSRNNRRDDAPPRRAARSPSPPRRSSFYESAAPARTTRSRSPRPSEREFRVNIENLPSDMTWHELKRLGSDYGKSVNFAKVNSSRSGDVSGMVAFGDKRDAEKFVSSLDGKRMEGCDRRLRVDMEQTRERKVSPSPVIRRDNRRY